jgi:hypothetical protein
MTPTPITDVQVIVKRIFTGIVYASGSPANPANIGGTSSSGSVALMGQMMIYMEILAIAVVLLRFFYRAWQWTGEENVAKFSVLARMIRIIMMDWFIIPVVIFASAIPMFFAQITPGALAPTCGLSSQVSQLGDALIRNMESAYTQFANGQMETALEQAKENNFSPDDVNSGYAALAKQFSTAHKNYIDAADEQDSIKRTIATSSTDVTGQDPSLNKRLQVAQKKVQGASQALTSVQATLQGKNGFSRAHGSNRDEFK